MNLIHFEMLSDLNNNRSISTCDNRDLRVKLWIMSLNVTC